MAPDLSGVTGTRESSSNSPSQSSNALASSSNPPPPTSNPPSRTSSRPLSGSMGPPPLPLASPSGSLSSRNRRPSIPAPLSPPLHSSVAGEGGGIPMRHPQPRTAAELYGEMEKEQEGIVNRLTRELSLLRAQTASAASNTSASSTSTTSTSLHGSTPNPNTTGTSDPHSFLLTGPTHPTPSRRHRSSSSLSRTSATAALSSLDQASMGSAIAGSMREPPTPLPPTSMISRGGSASTGTGAAGNPSGELQRQVSSGSGRSALPSPALTSARVAEAARERAEMEEAKRENAVLRERVRELEGAGRGRGV
ncbi:hypothetical protein EV356DRAFT_285218 [Viridothelium virens]|uniref:Uncharacterized protein n=1 Tax=Viridothelium virens TaxID=1048519 RepID=A0A6A6H181_VIRVR|nr:hypothetical protein EV356DRAFT_285218 [Viridothelium virens]